MPNYRQSIAHFLLKERKVNIISEIPERIKCIICKNVIFNAKQSPCGCHYCYECIANYLNGETKYCPGKSLYCQEEKININVNVVDDFSTDREIRQLKFRCQNIGCAYEDEVRLMDEHYQSCPYGEETCELCNECLPRMNIDKHMSDECYNRIVTCQFCGDDLVARKMIEEHININSDKLCKEFVSHCPLKCNVSDPVVICKHLLICANRPRNCPYDVVGCPAQGFTKRELNSHIKEHIFDHSKILFAKFNQYREEIISLKTQLSSLEDNLYSFVWKIDNFSSFIDSPSRNNRCLSPDFFLGKFSYVAKMELTIVDGNMKLYFSIVNSDYDDILKWPFDKNVTLAILDQSGNEKPYARLLKTSSQPNCFMKCDGKRKGLGWDKFVDLNTLQSSDYLLRNDRLFIKCTVHV